MDEEINYIIDRLSKSRYEILKFSSNRLKDTYKIDMDRRGRNCDCLGGVYNGNCKHVKWIRMIILRQKLPDNVQIREKAKI